MWIFNYVGICTPNLCVILVIWDVYGPYVIKNGLFEIEDPFFNIRFSFNMMISHCTFLICFIVLC